MPSLKPITVKLIASIILQPDGCEIHGCCNEKPSVDT